MGFETGSSSVRDKGSYRSWSGTRGWHAPSHALERFDAPSLLRSTGIVEGSLPIRFGSVLPRTRGFFLFMEREKENRLQPPLGGGTRQEGERRLRNSFLQFKERADKEGRSRNRESLQDHLQVPARLIKEESRSPAKSRSSLVPVLGSNRECMVQEIRDETTRRRSSLATYDRKVIKASDMLHEPVGKWMSTGMAQWERLPLDLTDSFSIPERITKPVGRHEAELIRKEIQENELLLPAVEKRSRDPQAVDLQCAAVYYRLGVLHDNLGKFDRAISMYESMREVATILERDDLRCIGTNCIGVALQRKAGEGMLPAMLGQFRSRPLAKHVCEKSVIEESLVNHEEHISQSSSLVGKFVASTNMAVCFLQLGNTSEAIIHSEKARKLAKLMADPKAMQVAAGNYACSLGTTRDTELEVALLEFVKLSEGLNDLDAQAWGHFMLGQCSERNSNLPRAVQSFQAANDVSIQAGNFFLESKALLLLGIVRGKMEFLQWKAGCRRETVHESECADSNTSSR